ncbi:MAG: hypothetical protein ACERKZ_05370 [Lachnotalea sp.]
MKIEDKEYREVEINKIVINGKEKMGNIISAKDTKDKQELNVTVYTKDTVTKEIETKKIETKEIATKETDKQELDTQSINMNQNKGKGNSKLNDLFKKCIFHRKRSES